MKEIHDPTAGEPKKRIVEKASNCILVKKSEFSQLVDSAYYETQGEGAKKLSKQTPQRYRGLSLNRGIRVVLVLFRLKHSTEDKPWEDCQGTQPYLFEPYDSEASSDTDFTNESDEKQFERPQNTEW